MTESASSDTFPRQYARTQRFTLGEPRTFAVSPDSQRVIFLRSRSGSDPVNCLWEFDIASKTERLVVDPLSLIEPGTGDDLSPEELARRERLREAGGGITSYSVDHDVETFSFAIAGQLFAGDFASGRTVRIDTPGPVFDPRIDPAGRRISFVIDGELLCVDLDRKDTVLDAAKATMRVVAGRTLYAESDDVHHGVADFVAAEEMGRHRGHWWSPDGRRLAVARVDESPVPPWTIADPAQPSSPARTVRYPAAGASNAVVGLAIVDVDSGERRAVDWDADDLPYLVDVQWDGPDTLIVTLQSRDQRRVSFGRCTWDDVRVEPLVADTSETWVDLVPGAPGVLSGGKLAIVSDRDGVKRLVVDGRAVTPTSIDVRQLVAVLEDSVVFMAIEPSRPQSWKIYTWSSSTSNVRCLTKDDGVHSASAAGSTVVIRRSSTSRARPAFSIRSIDDPDTVLADIDSESETPLIEPNVRFIRAGSSGIPCALILPHDVPAGARLPVLMDPYGGPHAQRVVDSYAAHCTSQWFADNGFAVVVADGRGTPGLGTDWERAIRNDLASVVLEDQVDALRALAEEFPVLDTDRVAIRGWSFGGYLAALAVLRRPDVFHAAIAGAPVTDWRLYDTHYTERYLGDPNRSIEAYERTSLIPLAARLERPLLLIHGLADDNVVAAHTLQLSSALLAAGKPHEVLPLSGVTHMTPQAAVAENLLLHQLDFLRRSLPHV